MSLQCYYETHLFRVSEELNLIPLIVGENSLYILLLNQLHTYTGRRGEKNHIYHKHLALVTTRNYCARFNCEGEGNI